ncbi:MAG: HepT-like ribonuclease domain-containing protein [Thermomicrobiales bacterium]
MHDQLTKRLLDARNACLEIEKRTVTRTLAEYSANYDLRLQVERLLEIVGEALRRAEDYDDDLERQIPELRSAVDLRNRVIHGYDGIDNEIIWLTASVRIPELRARIESVLDRSQS